MVQQTVLIPARLPDTSYRQARPARVAPLVGPADFFLFHVICCFEGVFFFGNRCKTSTSWLFYQAARRRVAPLL